jgi:acetylornithine deacetylase/succinyl-diaminopimelate desuccinylase-like protein
MNGEPRIDEGALRDETAVLLRELIRVDTSNPPGNETAAAVVLREYLEAAGLACELVAREPERANLIARLRGTGDGPSIALVGHTDVVPADAAGWRHPPFSGHLDADGWVWGRGAADMKNETASRAVALAALARSGIRPRGDVVLIAEADEEEGSAGVGMRWLVRERPDIRTDFALNEGASERLLLADGRTVVTINVGEKGAACARVTALAAGGASSTPRGGANAVPRLAELVRRLDAHRCRPVLPPAAALAVELLAGTEASDPAAALARVEALHPALADLVTPACLTTIAPTRLQGSESLNVLPSRASVECDCRTPPGASLADVEAELRTALGDDLPYELEFPAPLEGGSSSPVDTPLLDVCRGWLRRNDPDALLVPTVCNGFTDSHYLREAFGTVAYGFWPVRTTPYEVVVGGVHAANERIHVDDLGYATRFHVEACLALGAR